ncbi:hypothetical protein NQ166_01145 [Microbacterium sp. zg.Y1090]|uniref:hypothetical protein n=1 Tax=Microbacterium wangruii TaxID=3049073 RepID=UPI00214C6A31|nr:MULTISPECIES: hypothetical protein [unclassified Microbacterium]MCR2817434.1 hypothetical protein [Microbacterium sp. zg.Y1090]WIM29080.1 hypothetical protein QNO26_04065 [Microbacterium sp. zg-Y1090]
MDSARLYLIMYVAGGTLAIIISLLIAYWVIRLAVTHAMKKHTEWVQQGQS